MGICQPIFSRLENVENRGGLGGYTRVFFCKFHVAGPNVDRAKNPGCTPREVDLHVPGVSVTTRRLLGLTIFCPGFIDRPYYSTRGRIKQKPHDKANWGWWAARVPIYPGFIADSRPPWQTNVRRVTWRRRGGSSSGMSHASPTPRLNRCHVGRFESTDPSPPERGRLAAQKDAGTWPSTDRPGGASTRALGPAAPRADKSAGWVVKL